MYIEYEEKQIKEIEKLTGTDYECKGNLIPTDSIIPMIEDLMYEIERLNEQLEDEIADREDNYRPLTHREIEGVGGLGEPLGY